MPIENPDNWFLKKHENGEIFGPVHFDKIEEWAESAQVNPQDAVSTDKTNWTKAPMIPELKMDWLVVVADDLLYGPTTSGALLEFARLAEISAETELINCSTTEKTTLGATKFYREFQASPKEEAIPGAEAASKLQAPVFGNLRLNLQRRLREVETSLLEKQRQLVAAQETIARLETKVKDLEDRIRDIRGIR